MLVPSTAVMRLRRCSDDDRHGLAPPQGNRDAIDTHRDGIAADQTLMQDFDGGALNETELDQPALEVLDRPTGGDVAQLNGPDATSESELSATQRASQSSACTVFFVGHKPCFGALLRPWRMVPFLPIGRQRQLKAPKPP